MSEEESKPLYERYAVPAASGVLADIALANLHRDAPTEVDYAKMGRIPLLFIGFGEDHVVPPKATRHNERKYDDSASITEYREFEGPPPLSRCARLGGGRRLCDRLGRTSRRTDGEGSRGRGRRGAVELALRTVLAEGDGRRAARSRLVASALVLVRFAFVLALVDSLSFGSFSLGSVSFGSLSLGSLSSGSFSLVTSSVSGSSSDGHAVSESGMAAIKAIPIRRRTFLAFTALLSPGGGRAIPSTRVYSSVS